MALIPDNIMATVQSANTATSNIFTNVEQAIQNVGSIWDTITGKADSIPKTTAPVPAAVTAPTPPPAPAAVQAQADSTTKYALIGLGVLAVLGIFVLRK